MIARAEGMKERLLEHPAVSELSGALLGAARQSLVKYAGPDSPSPEPLERASPGSPSARSPASSCSRTSTMPWNAWSSAW
jgi:hypothetical protein